MDQLMYSWLSCCAIAPSVAAMSVWVLFMFYIYRRHWTNVDLFLYVLSCQEILSAVCVFAYSVVNVIRSQNDASCNLVVWGLTTVRIFQMSTLSSLAIDRALILKWPYKYRFTVRQNQIKYHLAVLACMSALVGTAGVFARLSRDQFRDALESHSANAYNGTCTLHPFSWDTRFNLFLAIIYGALILATFFSFAFILMNYKRTTSKYQPRSNSRISSIGDLTLEHLGSTEAIAKFNTGSYCSLYGFPLQNKEESISRRSVKEQFRSSDHRWFSVLGNTSLCFAVNHGPSLMFYLVAVLVPRFWSPIHDNALIWFTLAEGVLLPLSLYLTDPCFRESVKSSFKRRSQIYTSSLAQKDSFIKSKSAFGANFNEFVLIDKPYDTLMTSSKSPSKFNSSTLNLMNEKQRATQLNNNVHSNVHNFQSDYFPFLRKSKLLRNDCNLSQLFSRQFNREELVYQKTAINTFCTENQICDSNEKSTLKKIGLNNTRIWRGNALWGDHSDPLHYAAVTDHMYSSFEPIAVDDKILNEKMQQQSQDAFPNETLVASLDAFAVSASEDFEYRDPRKEKFAGDDSDNTTDNESDDTSILSSDSSSSEDSEHHYDNVNQFSRRVARGVGENKRRGWQCFSASDLHLIESSMHLHAAKDGEKKDMFTSRRSLSETNLLQSSCELFQDSLSRIQSNYESSESVNSRSTNASWFQNKLIEALKKRNGLNSVRNRQNSVLKSRRQLRYKKNVNRRRSERVQPNGHELTSKRT